MSDSPWEVFPLTWRIPQDVQWNHVIFLPFTVPWSGYQYLGTKPRVAAPFLSCDQSSVSMSYVGICTAHIFSVQGKPINRLYSSGKLELWCTSQKLLALENLILLCFCNLNFLRITFDNCLISHTLIGSLLSTIRVQTASFQVQLSAVKLSTS